MSLSDHDVTRILDGLGQRLLLDGSPSPILVEAVAAARLLAMSLARLDKLTRAGIVPVVKLDEGRLLYSPEALRVWARTQSQAHEFPPIPVRSERSPRRPKRRSIYGSS